MDWSFVGATFIRLIAALPLTLEVWALSVFSALDRRRRHLDARRRLKPLEGLRALTFSLPRRAAVGELFIVYYGLSSFPAVARASSGRSCATPFNCAVFLGLCTAAYQAEIFRGALLAVPHGQVEAARACGMSGSCFSAG